MEAPRPASYAIDRPEQTFLGRAFADQLPAGESGFRLLVSGEEAFAARAALAEAAQRSLDLQYYVVARDTTATMLLYRALRAAQRGVRVRLLLDDLYAAGRDRDLATLAAHPNVQVRVFNPFPHRGSLGMLQWLDFLGDGARLNRRMHNKLWIADNAVAVQGGRNLGDAYFNVRSSAGFADLDVLAAGPVVAQVSRSFDEYWNSEWAIPIAAFLGDPPAAGEAQRLYAEMAAHAERFRQTDYVQRLRAMDFWREVRGGRLALVAAPGTVLYDAPGKGNDGTTEGGQIAAGMRPIVEGARREVLLVSPYFIPSERGVAVLCGLARRSVRVSVLTNSLASTDVPLVHSGYARYRPRLLACGVELHEYLPALRAAGSVRPGLSSGASLHAKTIVVDQRWVLIGSMNLDPRSRSANTEIAALIESEALGQELGFLFEESAALGLAYRVELAEPGAGDAAQVVWHGLVDGRPVRYASEPLAAGWRRLIAELLGRFAPEDML
jgi:putative cardiolipin synthase